MGSLALVLLGSAGAVSAGLMVANQARTRPWSPADRSAFRVALDPGHGGRDPGAISSIAPLVEKDLALTMARLTAEALRRRGIGVVFTRTEDRYLSLDERAALAERSGAGLFLSLHLNSVADPTVHGAEAWHAAGATNLNLAGAVLAGLAHVLSEFDLSVRGTRFGPGLAVLRTPVPAALMEMAYLSNPREAALLTRPAFLARLAEGLAAGVERFRGDPGTPGGTAGEGAGEPGASVVSGTSTDTTGAAVKGETARRYRVRPGDTLTGIARQHGVELERLLAANDLADPDHIVAGKMLTIPPAAG